MDIKIRFETPGDCDKITSVNDQAFGQKLERELIAKPGEKPEFKRRCN